jgi:CRP/FNR family transcriptional regulator, cyclic AMP receptor protein
MAVRKTKKLPKRAPPIGFNIGSMLSSSEDGCTRQSHRPMGVVFSQGDAADAVFYIEAGAIQISVVSEQGKECVIAMLGAAEFFGEGSLAGQPVHTSSAIATVAARVIRIPKETMIRALHAQQAFAKMFTAFLLLRNIQIEADLVDQLFNSSEKRLARVLLLLANYGKSGQKGMVIPKVNQDVLAARVGTTRSRINFFMNKFRKLGFIEYNGHLKVNASLLNVIVLDQADAPAPRRELGRKPKKPKRKVSK